MLARAASRRSQRHTFACLSSQANQLYLPWLCPAVTAPRRRSNATVTSSAQHPDGRNQQRNSPSVATSQTRSLATTAENIQMQDSSVPFETYSTGGQSLQSHEKEIPLGWTKPLIVHNSLNGIRPRLSYYHGIGGDPAELHSNLHACLRVGRLDRAAALVRRLRELYNPTAVELVEANNLYLQHYVDRLLQKQPGYTMNAVNTWFEVEMRDNDVLPNAVTYTCMLRAAIATMAGSKRERLMRRYLGLAEQSGEAILQDTITSEAYTDEEYALIAEVRPDLVKGTGLADAIAEAENAAGLSLDSKTAYLLGYETEPLPEIKSVELKGMGLSTIRDALSIFTRKERLEKEIPYPHDLPGYTKEEKDLLYARMRQDRLEEDSVDAAINRWREENQNMQKLGITSALQTKPMEALMWQWYTAMVPLFKEELKGIKKLFETEDADPQDERLVTGHYLEAFTPEKLAATSLIVTVSSYSNPDQFDGAKLSFIALSIGKQLAMEHSVMVANSVSNKHNLYKKSSPRRVSDLLKRSTKETEANGKSGELARDAVEKYEKLRTLDWSTAIKAKIGALCFSKILEAAKVPIGRKDNDTGKQTTSYQPAFSHSTVYLAGRKVGMIRLHPTVLEKLKREPLRGSLGTKYPMVVEPLPWTGYRKGGYLRYTEPIIKDKNQDDAQKIYAMAAVDRGDMKDVMAGLTVLGKTAWRINHDVFKVVIEAWNTGEKIGGIAPENPHLEYPPKPGPDASRDATAAYIRAKRVIDNAKMGYHSQRCFQNFQLEVARAFKDEVFYFPHNMDFRGRAYPIPPLLNHLGADLARGLLTFAKGKELGTTGLTWLKIHLANVFGYDKASLKDREQFAMEHIADIYDSCENPLNGKRWWLTAEDPWQCLATCYELKRALDSPDPARYVSSLPVHQDGTCNGLQHYAALGGDKAGAAQVNLEPGDKPSDIYSAVAALVNTMVEADAEKGSPQAQKLKGTIARKVVKQTVMTNVYGVTFTGARLQVMKQLEAIFTDKDEIAKIPGGMFHMSGYVATLIFKALGQMFNGAQEIQNWLGACANRISTSLTPEQIERIASQVDPDSVDESKYRASSRKGGRKKKAAGDIQQQFRATVIWTTPLKIPVVQPYRHTKTKEISTVLQYLSIVQPKLSDAVDKRKQLQAFPPNFIHSLDATHMLLSAIKCNEIGLTFASVHDSFWTHAADIPLMNRVLRDAFVRMHSEDIVGRLHEEFQVRYKDCMYLASVQGTSALGKRIFHWRKDSRKPGESKTGHALMDELLLERQRLQLLQSEDPEEVAKGKAMITPGSLYAEAQQTEAVEVETADEVHVTKLGDTKAEPANPTRRPKTSVTDMDSDAVVGKEEDAEDLLDPVLGEQDDVHSDLAGEGEVDAPKPKASKARPAKGLATPRGMVQFWLPTDFPPVPKKGDFDVTRLKESQYFFS